MSFRKAALFIIVLALPGAFHGQAVPASMGSADISRYEAGGNYTLFRANAPPGQCGCFFMNGGGGTFLVNITPKWSALADIAVAKANHLNGTSQDLLVINYLFGPRYTYRNSSRWIPFAEILLGGSKADVNYRFDINKQSFAVLGGGGVTTKIKPRWGLTVVEVDYVYSRIPNANNNTQNNVRIVTGVTYHFGQ
jgi:hypothetical protein